MTVDEAAAKWSKLKKTTVKTVIRWINEDRIPYIREKEKIIIPDIDRPHIIRKDIKSDDRKVRKHIIAATEHFEYIDARAFMGKVNEDKFAEYIDSLETEGKLRRTGEWQDNKSNRWYIYNENSGKEKQITMNSAKTRNVNFNVGINNPSLT